MYAHFTVCLFVFLTGEEDAFKDTGPQPLLKPKADKQQLNFIKGVSIDAVLID